MPEIEGLEKLFSLVAKKKFGGYPKLGTFQLGWSHLGDDDFYLALVPLGNFVLGIDKLGDLILFSGIYRTDQVTGETKFYREPFYITRNPRKPAQQANRQKYADAIAGWKSLTPEEKMLYNERAKPLRISGCNLFVKEYMKSY